MTTLKELRDQLLELDRPDEVLKLADKYLERLREDGDMFVLPREHIIVKPILEHYATDDNGWLKFITNVRDRIPKGLDSRKAVQAFQRLVDVRITQRERRDRLEATIATAVRLGVIEDRFQVKQQYARRCTQEWLRRKREFVGKGNTLAERQERLKLFWDMIDQEIIEGKLPKP